MKRTSHRQEEHDLRRQIMLDSVYEAQQALDQEETDAYVDPGQGWAHDDPRWD